MRRFGILLTIGMLACGDPAGPPPTPLEVRFSGQNEFTGTRGRDAFGRLTITCDYTINASAIGGRPGEFAMWDGARLELRFATGSGNDFNLDNVEMVEWFGSDRIQTGSSQIASRRWTQLAAFTAAHIFRYRLQSGELKSGVYFLTCN